MLGLVGESGQGKSVTGLRSRGCRAPADPAGNIRFRGREITRIGGCFPQSAWPRQMAMIFQNQRAALNRSALVPPATSSPICDLATTTMRDEGARRGAADAARRANRDPVKAHGRIRMNSGRNVASA